MNLEPIKVILVTGSRKPSPNHVRFLRSALELNAPQIVIHGGATGTDQAAEAWCRENGIRTKVFRPNYAKFTFRNAPLERNWAMVEAMAKLDGNRCPVFVGRPGEVVTALIESNLVLAAPSADSRGTRHCMRAALKAGLTVVNVTGE